MSAALSYTLSLNAGGFLNPIRAAQGSLRGLLSTASQLGNIATGVGALQGILEGVVGLLSQPITLAADMESVSAQFEVMLGSGAKARAMLKDLMQFANTTPFESAGLARSAKTLLAFGIAGSNVVPTLRMLGDVAGDSQERLDQLTLAFAQISSAGKLQGQDLLQLINAGFNPLQEIARTTGRSMADLRDDMEKGAISAEMVTGAFRAATSAGGRFFQNTTKQGLTFNGVWSTVKDTMASVWRALGAPVINALKPVLTETTALLGQLVPWATLFGQKLAGGITTFFAVLKGGDLGNVLQLALSIGFKQAVNSFVATFYAASQSLGPLLLNVFGIGIRFLESSLPAIGTAFATGIQAAISMVAAAVAAVMDAVTDPKTMEGLKVSIQSIVSEVRADLMELFGGIISHIPGRGAVGDELQAGGKSVRGLADTQSIQAGVLLSQSHSAIGQALGHAGESIQTGKVFDFSSAMQATRAAAQKAGSDFSSAFSQAPKLFDTTADEASLSKTVASDLRKLTSRPIPVQIINQQGRNAGGVF